MEINERSPLKLLTDLLVPIDPKEANPSEMYVFESFYKKICDFGWISSTRGQLYFYESAIHRHPTLLYQMSNNFRLELIGEGHNFRFIKDDICLSIPRKFYEKNLLYEKLNDLFGSPRYHNNSSFKPYLNYIESYLVENKIEEVSVSKICCTLYNGIAFTVEDKSYCTQVVISTDDILFKITHPKYWCENENYWICLRIVINACKP